jgi:hypothetical protein
MQTTRMAMHEEEKRMVMHVVMVPAAYQGGLQLHPG